MSCIWKLQWSPLSYLSQGRRRTELATHSHKLGSMASWASLPHVRVLPPLIQMSERVRGDTWDIPHVSPTVHKVLHYLSTVVFSSLVFLSYLWYQGTIAMWSCRCTSLERIQCIDLSLWSWYADLELGMLTKRAGAGDEACKSDRHVPARG
jgi:hypothetical protein